MKVIIASIVVSVFLSGCAATKLTKEEEQKIMRDKALFTEQVIEPILSLIGTTCIYKSKKNKWPEVGHAPGENSLFSEYESYTSDNNTLISNFKLRSSSLIWRAHINYNTKQRPGICDFSLRTGKTANRMDINFSGGLGMSDIKNWGNPSKSNFNAVSKEMSSLLFAPYILAENTKPKVPPTRFDNFMSSFGEIFAKASICELLGISENQCH